MVHLFNASEVKKKMIYIYIYYYLTNDFSLCVLPFKARVNVKAALTSLNTASVSANISVTFQATLNLSAYFINHCLAVLCKFLVDFWKI